MKRLKVGLFFAYILVGAYLINFSLELYPMPDFLEDINIWLILVAGVFLIFSALSHIKLRKSKKE